MIRCGSCDIAYESLGRECPLCVANRKIEELKKGIEQVKDKILEGMDIALPFIDAFSGNAAEGEEEENDNPFV